MGLTTRKLQTELAKSNQPHYYEIRDEDDKRYCHCGHISDVYSLLAANPTFSYVTIYLPHPPQTVDVQHTQVAPDPELPPQQILPESQQEPFIPNYHD